MTHLHLAWALHLLTISTLRCVLLKSDEPIWQADVGKGLGLGFMSCFKARGKPAGLAAAPRGVVPVPATTLDVPRAVWAPRLRVLPEELAEASFNRNRITCFINVLIKLKCIYYFLLFLVE